MEYGQIVWNDRKYTNIVHIEDPPSVLEWTRNLTQ